MNNPKVHEAAEQFHNALLALGLKNPVIIYAFEQGEGNIDIDRGGWWGSPNAVLGVCERTKFNILTNYGHEA